MLFHWLRDPGSSVDLVQISCTLDSVDIALFVRAWEYLADRHAILRTVFRWQDVDLPVQDVVAKVPVIVREVDLRNLAPNDQQRRIADYLAEDRRTGFDFAAPPLFRLAFLHTAEQQHEFTWTFPHILLDGRSIVTLVRELGDIYGALVERREPMLSPVRPYRDFIEWLGRQDPAAGTAYWKGVMAGFDSPVFPDLGTIGPVTPSLVHIDRETSLSEDDTARLVDFVRRHKLTVNTMVQGAWALLLSRYSGADDVVFGATRAARRSALDGDPAVDQMVGLIINTLPVRVRIVPDQTVVAWLSQIRQDQVAVRAAEHTPLMQVQRASAVPSGIPLFDTLVVYEHERQWETFEKIHPRFKNFRIQEKTSFPISLHAYGETKLVLRLEYDDARFEEPAVDAMLGHLAALLRAMVANGEAPVTSLEMLSPAEHDRVVNGSNETARQWPGAAETLTELLRTSAAQSPAAIAVICGDESLTYAELEARATTLARALGTYGAGPGVLVGICMERSVEMVVALVGVLKSGSAYVPLDPEYPADRLAFMLADAQCPVVLTQERVVDGVLASIASADSMMLSIDRDWSRIAADAAAAPPGVAAGPDDLAYMIYTSGSTGKPKGALNFHRGIVNRLLWMQAEYKLGPDDVVLQKTPFSFDVSVWEFFWPLITGARLVLAEPGGHRDPGYLERVVRERRVTVMHFVPSMLRAFLDGSANMSGTSLRDVMCSGEALPFDLQERFFAQLPETRLHNLYGPTEAAVDVTYWQCRRNDPRGVVPIGRPVANTRMYVLDPARRPVPIGVPGELYIGGTQVGAGYHRRPELTAERFLTDPFANAPNARVYRTGDRARWLADGTLEYLGRLDFQVKLRGFRIEIGEIEAALAGVAGVRHAAVVLRSDPGTEPRLVAYSVPVAAEIPAQVLREALGATLPSYMVPPVFVALATLPLSPSGKLDRKALPAPERDRSQPAATAPRDSVEARLLRIWQDVLGTKGIGVTDHFNDVGGNSLAAVRVFTRVAKEFGNQLQLAAMLSHDTIEQLAVLLREPADTTSWNCIVPFSTTGSGIPIFCLHAQTGYVLIYQHFAKAIAGHHPVYGIQAVGNWGTQEPQETVEEMRWSSMSVKS